MAMDSGYFFCKNASRLDAGPLEDGAQRACRHIAGMIGMVVWQRVAGRCQISAPTSDMLVMLPRPL